MCVEWVGKSPPAQATRLQLRRAVLAVLSQRTHAHYLEVDDTTINTTNHIPGITLP